MRGTVQCVLYSVGGLTPPCTNLVTTTKQKGATMSKQGLAWTKVNAFIQAKAGIFLQDLPDRVCMEDWVDDDMTEKQIDSIVPDIAWEILESSGMNRKTVNIMCYGEDIDEY